MTTQKRVVRKVGAATETFLGDLGSILMTEGKSLLQEQIAQRMAAKSASTSVDPYEFLGVTRDMETEVIRTVWKGQAIIFADTSPGKNPERLKQINSAWAEIKKDRGLGRNDE